MQQQPIVIQQEINAWWALAAILATLLSGALGAIVGSILTMRKQKELADENSARERKLNIFRILMATRSVWLRFRIEHVAVLNTIPIEFDGNEKILKAWSAYLFEMNCTENNEEVGRRREERFFDLLAEMSKALGYKHDKEYLRNSHYAPSGYGYEAEDWIKVRKWAAEISEGKKAVPVLVFDGDALAPAPEPKDPVTPEPKSSSAEAGR